MAESSSNAASPGGEQGAPQRPAPSIDVKQLAEKVYRLMLADLRLQRARGQRVIQKK